MYKKTNLTTPLQIFHSLIPVDTELMYINIVRLYQSSYIRFVIFMIFILLYISYMVSLPCQIITHPCVIPSKSIYICNIYVYI